MGSLETGKKGKKKEKRSGGRTRQSSSDPSANTIFCIIRKDNVQIMYRKDNCTEHCPFCTKYSQEFPTITPLHNKHKLKLQLLDRNVPFTVPKQKSSCQECSN